jgi:hypothetical protein
MEQHIDDYNLYDEDFEEWQRRGIEAFKEEAEERSLTHEDPMQIIRS